MTTLTTGQVTALTAQAATAATYPSLDNTGSLLPNWYINDNGVAVYAGADVATRGVGIYGQTPDNLVLVGLLKSGALSLITQPSMTITVLNTPAAWTGTYNINVLADYLNATDLQNQVQIALLEGAYQGLLDADVITGTEDARYIATFLQPAVRYGVDAVVAYLEGAADPNLSTAIEIAGRQGQYAIDFVNTYGNALAVAPTPVVSNNTVVRDQVDQAVSDVVGNPKIPPLIYANVTAIAIDVATAANVAANIATNFGNVTITIPSSNPDDGTFRFAPGSNLG
jgi:hypothetical protein